MDLQRLCSAWSCVRVRSWVFALTRTSRQSVRPGLVPSRTVVVAFGASRPELLGDQWAARTRTRLLRPTPQTRAGKGNNIANVNSVGYNQASRRVNVPSVVQTETGVLRGRARSVAVRVAQTARCADDVGLGDRPVRSNGTGGCSPLPADDGVEQQESAAGRPAAEQRSCWDGGAAE